MKREGASRAWITMQTLGPNADIPSNSNSCTASAGAAPFAVSNSSTIGAGGDGATEATRHHSSVVDRQLTEPMLYIAPEQQQACHQLGGLAALAGSPDASLPCWIPQRNFSRIRFGRADYVRLVEEHWGAFVWAHEFQCTHTAFPYFEEPGITVDGVRYLGGSEHYYQLMKSKGTADHHKVCDMLASGCTPREAHDLARKHQLRPDWEQVKVAVMRTSLEAKVRQHSGLQELLLSTGTHPLVEVKPGDEFWGTGRDGRGGNMNGVILMEIRAALVEEARTAVQSRVV